MNAERLLGNFASTIDSPEALTQLRTLILRLAVTGKLIIESDQDRELRARDSVVADFLKFQNGYAFKSVWFEPTGVRLVRNTNIGHGTLQWGDIARISRERAEEFIRFELNEGDIVLSLDRPLISSGLKVARIRRSDLPSLLLQRVARPVFTDPTLDPSYFYLWLLSPLFTETISPGKSNGVPHIATKEVEGMSFSAPTVDTQARIVAKVDELMALCDELEVRQQERRAVHVRLNTAALDRLTTAETEQDFQAAWSRLQTHFDTLYTLPENVQALRQTILQLAVMGKLVPQDEGDEPAKLWLEKVIENLDSFETAADGIKGLPLPEGWSNVRLDIVFNVSGGIQKQPKRKPQKNHYPYLRVANVQRNHVDTHDLKRFELFDNELDRWRLERGDILVVEGNGSENEIGRCALWDGQVKDCVHQNHIIRCRPVDPVISPFVLMFLNSDIGIQKMKQLAITTSGLYSLSVGKIRNIFVPLPPVAEQQRILERAEDLFRLCDALLGSLNDSQKTAIDLTYAMIERLLSSNRPEQEALGFRKIAPITCQIVDRLHNSRQRYGKTKLAKLQYMVQHQLGIDLDITFERHAHGPLWTGLFPLINTAKKEGWFTYEEPQRKGRTGTFTPGEHIQPQLDACRQILGDKQAAFDELLDLFDTLDTTEAELLTTLYAVEHDFQKAGHTPTDEEIIEDFYDWHEAKKKFPRKQVVEMLARMRDAVLPI